MSVRTVVAARGRMSGRAKLGLAAALIAAAGWAAAFAVAVLTAEPRGRRP